MNKRAFSLVELLVVLGILAILTSILLPYLVKIREADRRVQCAGNLKSIMDALSKYASENKQFYPRVVYDSAHLPNGYTCFTGADSSDAFSKNSKVAPNDVTASLWLLVHLGYVDAKAFVCPSVMSARDPMRTGGTWVGPRNRSNFTSGKYLSYSYACPFGNAAEYKLTDTLPADFALVADKNPGIAKPDDDVLGSSFDSEPFDLARANSRNHKKAGQNVLYADGHVSFQPTAYCGVGTGGRRDNIYTALSPIPLIPGQRPPPESNGFLARDIGPGWLNDSYLVPAETDQ